MSARLAAIIVAGGTGERFGRPGGKQLAPLAGLPVVAWSIRSFLQVEAVTRVVVVSHPERVTEFQDTVIASIEAGGKLTFVAGGDTRQESVSRGLAALGDEEYVAIHDGARPLVTPETIRAGLDALVASKADGVVVGHASVDTIKVVSGLIVESTPDRSTLWTAQTPQMFERHALLRAHEMAAAEGFQGTDDATLLERAGDTVVVVEGPRWNFKVTHADDLAVAEALLERRGR